MKIVKSANDNKDYKYIVLQNGIKTLCISDTTQTDTYVCLTIDVGSYSDPSDYLGMAHFLEHMILTGSAKYPKTNYFMEFINKYGGYHNAYTTNTSTSYFFNIRAEFTNAALSIFSNYLIKPEFDKKVYMSEINSVDAEHKKNLFQPSFVIIDMLKYLVNKDHPYHNFTTGNKDTLNKKDTYKNLLSFYDSHYSSNLMKLTILSNKDVDTLEEIATKRFSKITNKGLNNEYDFKMKLFSDNKIIQVYSQLELLALAWEIPYDKKYGNIVRRYITKFIASNNINSLSYHLKQLNLFFGNIKTHIDNPNILLISIAFTSNGYFFIPSIVTQVQKYLKLLLVHGCEEWRYNEENKNILNTFDTKFNVDMDTVCDITENIGKSTDILVNMFSLPDFSVVEDAIRKTLEALQAEPRIVILSENYGDDFTDVDPFYHLKYKISTKFSKHFNNTELKFYYELPGKNIHILQSIKQYYYKPSLYPKKIVHKKDKYNLYYKNCQNNLPIKFILIYKNNYIEYSVQKKMMVLMLKTVVNNRISLKYNKLRDAGIFFNFDKDVDELLISINSYKENMNYAIQFLLSALNDKVTKQELYYAINILFYKLDKTGDKTLSENSFIVKKIDSEYYPVIFDNEEIKKQLEIFQASLKENAIASTVTQEFSTILHKNSFLNSIIYGNCYPKDAIHYFKKFAEFVKSSNVEQVSLKRLDGNLKYTFTKVNKAANNNIYCVLYESYHVLKADNFLQNMLLTKLIIIFLSKKFSYYMRNKFMLGYIHYVKNKTYNTFNEKVSVICFYIQSPSHTPSEIQPIVKQFIKMQGKNIINMRKEELEEYKGTILSRYAGFKKDNEDDYYVDCIYNNLQFNYMNDVIAILNKIDVTELIYFYESIFTKSNKKIVYEYIK